MNTAKYNAGDKGALVCKASAGRIADTYDFVLSTEDVDRHGDIVVQSGLNTKSFEQNPIALFQHDHNAPVGVWSNIRRVGKATVGTFKPVAKGTSRIGDIARSLLEQGVLKAVSIGFAGVEKTYLEPRGVKYLKSDLLEVSLVSVGANPNALMIAKSLSMTDDEIQKYLPTVASADAARREEEARRQQRERELLQQKAAEAIFRAHKMIRNMR